MFNGRRIAFIWIIFFAATAAVTAKTKYYDGETRPYEFGYRIEGNQHRHEKKDASGIINGEFGFITGDGIYHQTVYATDENGNFKLISLKSSFKFEKPTTTTAPPTTTSPAPPITHAPHSVRLLKSCSDCRVFEKVLDDKSSQDVAGNTNNKISATKKTSTPVTLSINDLPKMRIKSNNGTIGTISPVNIALGISSAGIRASEEVKLKRKEMRKSKDNIIAPNHSGNEVSLLQENNETDNTKTPTKPSSSHPITKPVAQVAIPVSLQTKSEITVPVSTDHIISNPPSETSKTHLSSTKAINDFIGDVLYRFNYTAGYHGHNEEGDSAGNKRGGYFIVGRDNIRRGVIYVANEHGFLPMIKYEKVSSEEAPHEDSEKSAGLRGYEFEWFHKGKSKGDGR